MNGADELPPYVHRKMAKGHPYYYFSMSGGRGPNRPALVRLPDISDPQFVRRVAELHEKRGVPSERRSQRTKTGAPPMVYFIGGPDGPIKIGMSCNPKARCANMQVGTPGDVQILATTPGNRRLEKAYHERFGFAHLRGEWFERHPLIMAEIDRLNETGTKEAHEKLS
jgi:hypothetical protein